MIPHGILVAAILWLSPHQDFATANYYADLIAFESRWYDIHPFVVVAITHVESGWNPTKVSRTNDWGLMQVHVARRGSNRFLGREKLLRDPRVNIREGVRILAMWKRVHRRWCKGEHPYWAHYKYGKKVKADLSHAEKVQRLFEALSSRFLPNPTS